MRRHPRKAEVDSSSPRAWATCDACGFVSNHYKLEWRYDWRGTELLNLRKLVCDICIDDPQRQLGTVILPPDPVPIINARPEQYFIDENTQRHTQTGQLRYQMDGTIRIQSNSQMGTSSGLTYNGS